MGLARRSSPCPPALPRWHIKGSRDWSQGDPSQLPQRPGERGHGLQEIKGSHRVPGGVTATPGPVPAPVPVPVPVPVPCAPLGGPGRSAPGAAGAAELLLLIPAPQSSRIAPGKGSLAGPRSRHWGNRNPQIHPHPIIADCQSRAKAPLPSRWPRGGAESVQGERNTEGKRGAEERPGPIQVEAAAPPALGSIPHPITSSPAPNNPTASPERPHPPGNASSNQQLQ